MEVNPKRNIYQSPKFQVTVQFRGGSRAAATSKIERFVAIVKGWKPLTIITKCFILYVSAALDPPLQLNYENITVTLYGDTNSDITGFRSGVL